MRPRANSDGKEDQQIKLQIRDAVLGSLRTDLQKLSDANAARDYLRTNLPKIQETAKAVLQKAGIDSSVAVTLGKEAFSARVYDTFTLPSGVYESLRIVIGEGQGKNWWCVTFPSLCMPEGEETFADAAAAAGFSGTLCETLGEKETHEIRFFLLDKLGQLENILFAG